MFLGIDSDSRVESLKSFKDQGSCFKMLIRVLEIMSIGSFRNSRIVSLGIGSGSRSWGYEGFQRPRIVTLDVDSNSRS